MELIVMSVNIQHGGTGGRWRRLAEVIATVGPHILFLQELCGWLDDDLALHAAAERDLGMRLLIAPSRTGFHVGLGYIPACFGWAGWETRYAHLLDHGYGAARLTLPGLPLPLVAISAHLSPYSAARAAQEAQVLIARAYRHGGLAIIGGDINHAPLGDPEPDWGAIPPHNTAARAALPAPGGGLRTDPAVGQRFALAEMADVAAWLADHGHPGLRAPTAKAGHVRTDQFHITPALLPALTGYQVLDAGDASDHDGIVATFDLDRADLTRTHPGRRGFDHAKRR